MDRISGWSRSRQPGRRWAAPLVLALAAAGGLTAAKAAAGPDLPAPAPPAASDRAGSTSNVLTLADGTRIGVTELPGGRTSYRPLAGSAGVEEPLRLVTLRGETYILPSDRAKLSIDNAEPAADGQPTHTLTVKVRDREGEAAEASDVLVMDVNNLRSYLEVGYPVDGRVEFTVPAGDYAVIGTVHQTTSSSMVAEQELHVDGDTELTLSASAATAQVRFPKAMGAEPVGGTFHYIRAAEVGGTATTSWMFDPGFQLYIEPSAAPAIGDLRTGLKSTMRIPRQQRPDDLVMSFDWQPGVPEEMDHRHERSDFAEVVATYHSDGREREAWLWRATEAFIPGQGSDWSHGWELPTPSTRHEFYLADPDVKWLPYAGVGSSEMKTRARYYRAGQRLTEAWLRGPLHPGAGFAVPKPPTGAACPACRSGDVIRLNLGSFTDSEAHHWGISWIKSPWMLRRGDVVVGRGDWPQAKVEVPAANGRYTLRMTNDLPAEFRLSEHARTTWGFDSRTSDRVLPLLLPRYTLPVDHQNRLPAGKTSFRLAIPRLGVADAQVKLPTVKVSYNGGKTWTSATVVRQGADLFRVHVVNPKPGDQPRFGSLQVQAEDRAGNTVREVVTRAWRIRG